MQEKDEQPVFSLIQRIKDGTIAPETINKELRRRCVDVLQGEGYSVSTMAQIFQKSEKTLKRDLDVIWDNEKLKPAVELAKKTVGEFVGFARIHRNHLMRLARSKNASVAEKAQAEFFAFKVSVELIAKLQTLGYLPSKPQAIVGDIFHHVENTDQDMSFPELKAMVVDIVNTAKETNTLTPELEQEAESLKIKIEKTEVISQVKNLQEKNPKKEEENDQ